MAFLNQRFPDRIARGAVGGLGWRTTILEASSGHESAISHWSQARGRWNVSQAIKAQGAHDKARDFLHMARGRFHRWRFKDHTDFQVSRAQSRLVAVTGGGGYRVCKAYGDDPTFEYVRRLTRIVPGTFQAFVAGVPTASTIDVDTGITNVGADPETTFTCEFDVPCRFDTDKHDAKLMSRKPGDRLLILWDDIDIVEVLE